MAQARQLSEARREFAWLREGAQMVPQQALRDFAQAMSNFFARTHRRPAWRKAGRHEGFRIVAVASEHVRRLSRNAADVWVPRVGRVRFRLSRSVPEGVKSYRITWDAGRRRHSAFAAAPVSIDAPGDGAEAGMNRGILAQGGEFLARRLEDKTSGRVVRDDPA